VYSCETGKVLLSHTVPSPALSVAVTAAPKRHHGASSGGGKGHLGASRSSSSPILHAFTKSGQIHRWYLPPRISISADFTSSGASASISGVSDPDASGGGGEAGGGMVVQHSFSEVSSRRGRVRAAVALPASSSPRSGGGSGGRQLIVFAGDRGLAAVDAGRGVIVQEFAAAGGEGEGEGEAPFFFASDARTLTANSGSLQTVSPHRPLSPL